MGHGVHQGCDLAGISVDFWPIGTQSAGRQQIQVRFVKNENTHVKSRQRLYCATSRHMKSRTLRLLDAFPDN
jgi:hypothetical protein